MYSVIPLHLGVFKLVLQKHFKSLNGVESLLLWDILEQSETELQICPDPGQIRFLHTSNIRMNHIAEGCIALNYLYLIGECVNSLCNINFDDVICNNVLVQSVVMTFRVFFIPKRYPEVKTIIKYPVDCTFEI